MLADKQKTCDECKTQTIRSKARRKDYRRRMQAGANRERYTMDYVAARDAYRCGLCHQPVPMRMVVPHPHAPTIDHIHPLSMGGDDTKANVQLAHFKCNSTKAAHAHPTDQLRLVG
jgi:5-methylcytosine-specific restriction endonuclease McrA